MIPHNVDIIIGGAPCTDFSFAGRRKGMITTENVHITTLNQYMTYKNDGFEFVGESYLYWEFVRIIDLFKPTYFLLENVVMNKNWEDVINNGLLNINLENNLITNTN